jgi:cyclohexanecarboxyl-CoA dehydrogenase
MGLWGAAMGAIGFDQVKIPVEYRLGAEGEGLDIHIRVGLCSSLSQILSGVISIGASQEALNQAVSYTKKRLAFGRPLAQFQAVSGKIAEDLTLVEAGRWLCYRALRLKEHHLPHAKESAMCSWWCPRIAYEAIHHALLIHGHMGYTDDLPLEGMLRDITAFHMIGGAEPLMKLIIAYETMGKVAIPEELAPFMGNKASGLDR